MPHTETAVRAADGDVRTTRIESTGQYQTTEGTDRWILADPDDYVEVEE
jgi:hypothetical protein